MPAILVPGVAQATLRGVIGSNPFNCIFHYKLNQVGVNWSQAQLQNLADGLMGGIALTNGVAQLTLNSAVFQQVVAVDIGTSTPFEASSTHAAITGVETGTLSNQVAVLVSGTVNARYRGGKPRTYMPPGGSANIAAGGDSWTAAFVASYQTAFTNMQDTAFNAVLGITQVVVRYNYTYTPSPNGKKIIVTRESLNSTPQVLGYTVKGPLGTQRRRVRVGG